jgi:uncharacterized SAM-binding protein YcdF (DUF218 family)
MKTSRRMSKGYRFIGIASSALIVLLFSSIPLRLAIASYQTPQPQVILTLGGSSKREEFTSQFAKLHPSLEIWLSTGSNPKIAAEIFRSAGIPDERVHLDWRAVDTVTNFTTLIGDFKRRGIQHLYLLTEDFHMPRAKAIATIILGSQGIAFTPVSIPSNEAQESWFHILRDIGRSIIWLFTGRTGASLKTKIEYANRYLSKYSLLSPSNAKSDARL